MQVDKMMYRLHRLKFPPIFLKRESVYRRIKQNRGVLLLIVNLALCGIVFLLYDPFAWSLHGYSGASRLISFNEKDVEKIFIQNGTDSVPTRLIKNDDRWYIENMPATLKGMDNEADALIVKTLLSSLSLMRRYYAIPLTSQNSDEECNCLTVSLFIKNKKSPLTVEFFRSTPDGRGYVHLSKDQNVYIVESDPVGAFVGRESLYFLNRDVFMKNAKQEAGTLKGVVASSKKSFVYVKVNDKWRSEIESSVNIKDIDAFVLDTLSWRVNRFYIEPPLSMNRKNRMYLSILFRSNFALEARNFTIEGQTGFSTFIIKEESKPLFMEIHSLYLPSLFQEDETSSQR